MEQIKRETIENTRPIYEQPQERPIDTSKLPPPPKPESITSAHVEVKKYAPPKKVERPTDVEKRTERKEKESKIERIAEEFCRNQTMGLARWYANVKMIRGTSIGNIQNDFSRGELYQTIGTDFGSTDINKTASCPSNLKDVLAWQLEEEATGNVIVFLEPAITCEEVGRRVIVPKKVKTHGIKGFLGGTEEKPETKTVTDRKFRTLTIGDLGYRGKKPQEEMVKLTIEYPIDNSGKKYAEGRPGNQDICFETRRTIATLLLKEIEKDPDNLWSFIKIAVPGFLEAAPVPPKNFYKPKETEGDTKRGEFDIYTFSEGIQRNTKIKKEGVEIKKIPWK